MFLDWFAVLIAIWLLSVGGVIGSFLNVVVYRLPLGMSLWRPGSRCPHCATPIRLSDNLPVIGWLRLGGRCRTCGAPIAARYPLVEGVAAMFFVALAVAEFCWGGARDPLSSARAGFHQPWASDLSAADVWMRYWLQIVLAMTLLAAALIERDGRRVPSMLFAPAAVLAVLLPLAWRSVRPLPFELGSATFSAVTASWRLRTMDLLLGILTGLASALVAWPLVPRDDHGRRPFVLGLLIVGMCLGWQLTIVLAAPWGLWLLCVRIRDAGSSARPHGLLSLVIVAWAVLLLWRPVFALVVSPVA